MDRQPPATGASWPMLRLGAHGDLHPASVSPRRWASNGSGVLLMASIKCPHRWEGGRGQSGDWDA